MHNYCYEYFASLFALFASNQIECVNKKFLTFYAQNFEMFLCCFQVIQTTIFYRIPHHVFDIFLLFAALCHMQRLPQMTKNSFVKFSLHFFGYLKLQFNCIACVTVCKWVRDVQCCVGWFSYVAWRHHGVSETVRLPQISIAHYRNSCHLSFWLFGNVWAKFSFFGILATLRFSYCLISC